MKLQTIPVPIYGDTAFRGACHSEDVEQISFMNRIRKEYPESFARVAFHTKNEGNAWHGNARGMSKLKAMGLTPGVADIIIMGAPGFCCELKRADHTKSKISADQIAFLRTAQDMGAFACVALGAVAAWEAFEIYLDVIKFGY